ncbi:MAG: YbjN domain-containing protein [Cyanobacteria bacterium]|nr:YbjN domain-containing protein [Cyanobacteriota bacterium]
MDKQNDQSSVKVEQATSLFQVALAFCEEMKFRTTVNRDDNYISLFISISDATVRAFLHIEEEQESVIFRTYCPVNVPEHARERMAEMITRINFSTKHGCFIMDMADGELVYKTSVSVVGSTLSTNLIRNIVYVNLMTMERWLPAMMTVIYSGASPEHAFKDLLERVYQSSS